MRLEQTSVSMTDCLGSLQGRRPMLRVYSGSCSMVSSLLLEGRGWLHLQWQEPMRINQLFPMLVRSPQEPADASMLDDCMTTISQSVLEAFGANWGGPRRAISDLLISILVNSRSTFAFGNSLNGFF